MKRAWLIIVLGLAAGAMLLLGGLLLGWWVHDDAPLRTFVGLREARLCRGAECSSIALHRLGGAQDLPWVRAGLGAYAAAWMAGILCLAVAAMAAADKTSRLLPRTALVALASAAAVGVLFLLWAPAHVSGAPGPGMMLFFAGSLLGAGAAILAVRRG